MLEALRRSTGGIVAKILLGLLVISFAIWGASGAFTGGLGNETIRVGDTRVSMVDYRLAYQTRVGALEQQLNQTLTREQVRSLGIDQSVTNQLVAGAVLDQSAREMGLGVSEDQLAKLIGDDPTFKDSSGNFSRERLIAALRSVGMSEDQYVRNQHAVAMRNQLVSGLAQGVSAPDTFYAAFSQYQSEKRVFDHVVVDRSAVTAIPEPTETDLSTFYEANKDKYVAPEYRKLIFVRLLAEDIAKPDTITAEEIAAQYEATKAQHTRPEQRRIQQIAFQDAAAAKAAADKLAAGESFDAVLTGLGRTAADADLGLLRKDQIPDAKMAEAAFGLAPNTPSGIVEGAFGPVILRVTEIVPQAVTPLNELEAELREELAERKAGEVIFETHDKLEDERAAGDPLTEAARKVGLTATTVEQVDAQGNDPSGKPVENLPEKKALLEQAFATDEGVEADPVNIGSSGFVWFEVAGVTPQRQKPLTEVRDAVKTAWIEAEVARKIDEIAKGIADRVSKGEDFAAVAASVLPPVNGAPQTVKQSGELTRTDSGADMQAEAVAAGFALPEGGVTTAPAPQPPARIVLRVSKVIPGEEISAPVELRSRVDSQLSDDLVSNLVGELQTRQEVIINPAAIDAALQF
jgi:peptidyl-prolyl cis-trans isomerase D